MSGKCLSNKLERSYRRPSASNSDRSSRRNNSIDRAPRKGPGTSITKTQRQLPKYSAKTGNNQMTNIVIANPTPIWNANAEPTIDWSESSVTAAENWALSATAVNPQINAIVMNSHGGPLKQSPIRSALVPEITMRKVVA